MMVILFNVKTAIANLWTGTGWAKKMRYPASETAEKHEKILRKPRGCFANAASAGLVSPKS
jgi:hypothetical protein